MTRNEARNTTVYVFNDDGRIDPVGPGIEKTTLYDHIMQSEDLTTTPQGVGPRMHVRKNNQSEMFEIWTWGVMGNNPQFTGLVFDTQEEADESLFQMVYESVFLFDDQRDISYFKTKKEAEKLLKERRGW
jgi:hypothetical protein